ncbi:MAG: TonB-dependent receptor domain-containing protein [Bryobacteraceae bacterium]
MFALVCSALPVEIAAQESRATLLGRVVDATGSVIPGAGVTVLHEATNTASRTQTNAEGHFITPPLDPGMYSITVEATGFKKSVKSGVELHVADRIELEFRLEVGALTESVTVTGEAGLVETTRADLSQVVDRRFVDLLYIPNRNPLGLVSLTAGVEGGGGRFTSTEQQGFSVHGGGATTGNNEIIVDGASVVMPRQGGAVATSPGGDAVEEVRVQTTMFDAAYGHSNGGVVTYATRGGTNQVHGSFEMFYRNKVLEANGWTNNRNGLERGDVDRTFFSGTLGGPVYLPRLYNGRNRTFFFMAVEGENVKNASLNQGRVPTELERKGDFSQTLNSQGTKLDLYDPFSTVVSGVRATRQPFPNAKIPASLINETGAAMINAFPMPNQNVPARLGLYNWASLAGASQPGLQLSGRIDQVVSQRQKLFGRFSYMRQQNRYENLPQGLLKAPVGGQPNEALRHFWNASLNDDLTLGPSFVVTLRANFGRYANSAYLTGNRLDPAVLKVPEIILRNSLTRAWPGIDIGDGSLTLGNALKERANDTWSFAPAFTKLAGAHSIRFGADLRLVNWNEYSPGSDAAGAFKFTNTFTRSDPFTSSTGRTSGAGMASLLLGVADSGNLGGPTPYSLRDYYYGLYVQDEWKIARRLTLNLGLRYELETPWRERYDRLSWGFDYDAASPIKAPGLPVRGGLVFANTSGRPRWQGNMDRNNFGPRAGVVYELRPGTVLRAGYGLFFASPAGNLDTGSGVPSTFNVSAPYVGTTDGGATPYTTISNPYPNGVPAPPGNKEGLATRAGTSLDYLNQNRVVPYTQQWQFSVQQALPFRMRLEAAYVGMLSLKGFESFGLNEKPDAYLALGAEENRRVPNPFYGVLPASTSLGSSSTVVQRQLWLAYPQYTSLGIDGVNSHTTAYNGLEVSLDKRFSHGLSLIWNYRWAKMMENNLTSMVNTRHYRAISDADRARVVNLAVVYELPFAAHSGRLVRAVAGGWTISGRTYLASGTPMSISDTNGRPIRLRNAALGGRVRDRLGDRRDSRTGEVLNPYFDTTAFVSLPTQYTISPEPPMFAELRSPGRFTTDLSLIKRFTVWERLKVDARMDAVNFTNTPQFESPGTNMANKATFGVIERAGNPRVVQLAFRAVF